MQNYFANVEYRFITFYFKFFTYPNQKYNPKLKLEISLKINPNNRRDNYSNSIAFQKCSQLQQKDQNVFNLSFMTSIPIYAEWIYGNLGRSLPLYKFILWQLGSKINCIHWFPQKSPHIQEKETHRSRYYELKEIQNFEVIFRKPIIVATFV